ncbi:MAG: serine hydrolase [Bacteroidales bacterium]|nr:serine hydrolase [Bacteroidales bacterium]MDD4671189.1 serine hydrolase [Bacteroidales bacterium]
MIQNIFKQIVFLVTIIGMVACSGRENTGKEKEEQKDYSNYFPGKTWEGATPEEMGYSSEKFAALEEYIKNELTTTHIMVVVNGKVIFAMGDLGETARIASCRKSLLSMMYGKYVENGTINLDATLADLGIDDNGGLLEKEKQAKVRHLITARSGVFHPASNDGDDSKYAPARGSVEPGTYFLYNNWDFNCAGGVFEQLTGKNIYTAFMEDIAKPIGMQDYLIEKQQKTGDLTASKFPAYHFWISTRDMARVGYLMLKKGNWNGTQVISEEWVKTITSVVTPRSEMNPESRHRKQFDYGYLWWLFSKEYTDYAADIYEGGYTATGLGGQYITVLPKLNMVIAHKDINSKMEKSTYYDLIKMVGECKK